MTSLTTSSFSVIDVATMGSPIPVRRSVCQDCQEVKLAFDDYGL